MKTTPHFSPQWRICTAVAQLVVVGMLSACAAGPGEEPAVVVDSSGITIFRNLPPVELSLNEEPLAILGGDEGDTASIFSGIRDLVALRDGRIVVGDRDRSVRWYGPDGELLRRVGRSGDGPGEYREIYLVRRIRGDTLVVFDTEIMRATLLTSDGEFARTAQVVPPGIGVPYDIMEDGRIVWMGLPPAADKSAIAPGRWARAPVLRIDPATGGVDSIGSYLAVRCSNAAGEHCIPGGIASPFRAFRSGAIAANADENRLVAFGDSGEIEFIIELGMAGLVREIVADAAGGVWVEVADQGAERNVWIRIDLESGARSSIRVGRNVALKSVVGPDRFVVEHRDSLGVQTVRVLEIAGR